MEGAEKGEILLQQATLMHQQGRAADAVRLAHQAIGLIPSDPRPFCIAAASMARLGDRKAIPMADRGIAADPANAWTHSIKGQVLLALGKEKDAIPVYLRSLELDPNRPNARMNLGICYLSTKKPKEARAHLEWAVQHDPENAAAHLNLGLVYHELGEKALRDDETEAAIRLAPDESRAQYLVGLSRLDRKDDRAAAIAFRESLRLEPNFFPAKHALIVVASRYHPFFGPAVRLALAIQRVHPRWRYVVALIPGWILVRVASVGLRTAAGNPVIITVVLITIALLVYWLGAATLLDLSIRRGWLDIPAPKKEPTNV